MNLVLVYGRIQLVKLQIEYLEHHRLLEILLRIGQKVAGGEQRI